MQVSVVALLHASVVMTLPAQHSTLTTGADSAWARWLPACAHPAENPEWRRQSLNLLLTEETAEWVDGFESARPKATVAGLPQPFLGLVLESIAKPFLRISGLDTVVAPKGLPVGEPRYRASMMLGDVHFRLRGDGGVDSVVLHDVVDSALALDLTAALRTAVVERTVPAYGDTTSYRTLHLSAEFWSDSASAHWPVLTLDAPVERGVQVRDDNRRLPYPVALRRWNAELLLQFVVEPDGTVRPGSIRNLKPPTDYTWPKDELRQAYVHFVEQTIAGVTRWRYTPAVKLGCRVPQLVQQPFDYVVKK